MGYPAKKQSKYTYSDYLKTPDDKRFQLIEGELLMTPAPTTKHQRISRNLSFLLNQFVRTARVGEIFYAPTDVVLDDFNVFQPDILLVLNENKGIITKKNIQGAPDLVIEILSDSTASLDLIEKRKLYGQFGVKEYWVASPEHTTIEMYGLKNNRLESSKSFYEGETLASPLLTGLEISLADIFSE